MRTDGDKFWSVEDEEIKTNNHSIRAYWGLQYGPLPKIDSTPLVYADGKVLFRSEASKPDFVSISRGSGRTYILMSQSDGPGSIDDYWILDVSNPSGPVMVTAMIRKCDEPKEAVVNGAFRLTCPHTAEAPAAVHTYKDGVYR